MIQSTTSMKVSLAKMKQMRSNPLIYAYFQLIAERANDYLERLQSEATQLKPIQPFPLSAYPEIESNMWWNAASPAKNAANNLAEYREKFQTAHRLYKQRGTEVCLAYITSEDEEDWRKSRDFEMILEPVEKGDWPQTEWKWKVSAYDGTFQNQVEDSDFESYQEALACFYGHIEELSGHIEFPDLAALEAESISLAPWGRWEYGSDPAYDEQGMRSGSRHYCSKYGLIWEKVMRDGATVTLNYV